MEDYSIVSPLMGQEVQYSITKVESGKGVVIDKVIMREKVDTKKNEEGDQYISVTGYMIQSMTTQQIIPIAYWRIQAVLNADGQSLALKEEGWVPHEQKDMPKGNIKGGYRRP